MNLLSVFIGKKTYSLDWRLPPLCTLHHCYSAGRMPLASSSFLRVSSHCVNCLDSRNIWNSRGQGSVGGASCQQRVWKNKSCFLKQGNKLEDRWTMTVMTGMAATPSIKACTILLYSSKSFLTSWDWTSIWSYAAKTRRSQNQTD